MLWIIILHRYKSLIHKPRSRWDRMMLQYAVIASLIQFALSWCTSPTLQVAKALHTITEPPPCFTVGVIQKVAALSPTLRRTQTHLFDRKISNFDSLVQRTLFRYSSIQALCTLAHWSFLTLFCLLNSGFLTAILPYRPASRNLLFTVDADNFFTTLFQLCSAVWSSQSFVTQAGVSE